MTPENINYWHYILVMLSGGKDSIACLLDLINRGFPPERIELWHHIVDGREGSNRGASSNGTENRDKKKILKN